MFQPILKRPCQFNHHVLRRLRSKEGKKKSTKRFIVYLVVVLCTSVETPSNFAKVPPIEQTKDKPTLTRRDRDAPEANPDLKPSGTIVFSSSQTGSQDIYSLDLATGHQKNLTNNRSEDGYPRCSPDGKKIAFATNRDGSWEIYVMNRDGSDQRNLTRNRDGDGYMDWSPDAQSLVFSSARYGERNNDIYSIRLDGSGLRRITNDPSEDVHPVWSPDGEHIAFASERDGARQLYLWNSKDGSVDRLTNSGSYDDYPAWSPDGKRIAFASGRDSGSSSKLDIYVATLERATRWVNLEGKRTKIGIVGHFSAAGVSRLIAHPSDDRHPTWSPDGKMLAFVSDRDGDRDIFVVNGDGTGLRKIVAAKGNDEHPHWNAYSQPSQEPTGEDSYKRRPTLKRRKEGEDDSIPTELKRFPSLSRYFIIDYPRHWNAQTPSNSSVEFSPDGANQVDLTLYASIGYLDNINEPLETTMDWTLRIITKYRPYLTEPSGVRHGTQLEGNSALATYLKGGNRAGRNVTYWILVQSRGHGVFILHFVAPHDEWNKYGTIFEAMVRSFRASSN